MKFDSELANYVRGWDGNINNWGGPIPESYRNHTVINRVYEKYKNVLTNLSDNGANMIRTIMTPHATEIEWERLGDYTNRLPMAQEMDGIVELAEFQDFYLLWDMQIHYSFQPSDSAYYVFWAWDSQPNGNEFCYNNLIGTGEPLDFFTHTEAKKYYKQRIRYILARWGYSTNIGIFELFSEINQVTLNGTKTGSYYKDGNWEVFADWQREMGNYIRTHHNGNVHILTSNTAAAKHKEDDLYLGGPLNVMSLNNYDIAEPTFGKFFVTEVAKQQLNEDNNTNDARSYIMHPNNTRDVKPLIYSETGVLELTTPCDYNKIEMDRILWQSIFSGLAGAFDWDLWYRDPNTIQSLAQASNFIQQHKLDEDSWHPGATKRVNSNATPNNLKAWKYKENYAKRMEGKTRKADLSYLRSGDRNYAIGVITNKTYNIYSVRNCFDDIWFNNNASFMAGWLTNLQEIDIIQPVNCEQQKLKLKNMRGFWPSRFYINYFIPSNLSAPVHSSDDMGPNVKIEYQFPGGSSDYITIIMARKKNTSWLPTQADSSALADFLKENFLDTTSFDISVFKPREGLITVFPVPSSDEVNIKSNEYTKLNVLVVSTDGKQQDFFIMKRKNHILDISNYQNGVYFLKFYLGEDLIETKKIVKL